MDDTSKFAAPVPRRSSCADDTVDDEDEDYDGDDDDNHIEKERQAKVFTIAMRYESPTLILYKGACQKRFSGFCPLRGYPPPLPP